NLKQALLDASELDTMLIMRSINATHRVLSTAAAKKCAEIETKGAELPEILDIVSGEKARQMYDQGDLDAGIISCGQGVGLIHDIPSVQELFDKIIKQATDIYSEWS
ncbi:MAG: nitronate monooxygenase, partial [Deltaproteobacteria bacterium]|nr:nitronate monooxygenase [Deltaproteobacteria bacterium]